jgi:hypothetical protein
MPAVTGDAPLRDPRTVLTQDKLFTLRPKPLEQWLWRHQVAPSAERVFWLHWQEGMRNADWCSAIPLRRVAQQCCLDVSTVTRAYQRLIQLQLLRRADPGRDATNPFQQATAITEVRLPPDLVAELSRHTNRRAAKAVALTSTTAETARAPRCSPEPVSEARIAPVDPFKGLPGRERLRAISQLREAMSTAERRDFDSAQRLQQPSMRFEPATRLTEFQRSCVLQLLALMGTTLPPGTHGAAPLTTTPTTPATTANRKLSTLELARLRQALQRVPSGPGNGSASDELLRQVAWAVEEGALRRFSVLHGSRIALKKIREGAWTRPNRMPPHWTRCLSRDTASGGTCRTA